MRNIAVCIGNRADEGPLTPVLNALNERGDIRFEIIQPFSLQLNHLRKERYDLLLVLGDRHELLLACHSAIYAQIPIAHIHGGETTLGSFDDKVRNAVSQLADLHFTAAECFSDKLRAMKVPGEIFTVGPPGLDDLETDDVSEFGEGFFLVCLHPDTTRDEAYNAALADAVVTALQRFPERRIVMIGGNDDPGGKAITNKLISFCRYSERSGCADLWRGVERKRYLTALKHCSVAIGNSSSFVIEAPALGTPVVLVGDRQKGRPLATSIYNAEPDAGSISAMIETAMACRAHDRDRRPPYGVGGASKRIAEKLATWSL
jgi:UDP-hydrolysing UDP-N-acetyl-D-glucosamine 2-epimerase